MWHDLKVFTVTYAITAKYVPGEMKFCKKKGRGNNVCVSFAKLLCKVLLNARYAS